MLHLPVLMTQNTGDLHSCRYGETRAHSHRQNTCVGIIQRSQQLKLLYTNIVFNQQNEKGGKKNSRNCFKYKKNMWCEVVYFAPIHTQTPSNHLKVSVNWMGALAYISAPATSQFFFFKYFCLLFHLLMRCACNSPLRPGLGSIEHLRHIQRQIERNVERLHTRPTPTKQRRRRREKMMNTEN